MHTSETLNHLGEEREKYFNAVSPPIIQSSNFTFPTLEAFRQAFTSEFDNHVYTRGNNPTVAILRKKIAAQEYMTQGPVISPNDAALVIRGLRTLELRVTRSDESAQWLAQQLESHPKVEQVIFFRKMATVGLFPRVYT